MSATYRQIPTLIEDGDDFTGNTMHAEHVRPGYFYSTGKLPDDEHTILRHALADADRFGEELYVVFSYETPIAWALDGRALYVPDVHYSRTTSRHQGICRAWGTGYSVAA